MHIFSKNLSPGRTGGTEAAVSVTAVWPMAAGRMQWMRATIPAYRRRRSRAVFGGPAAEERASRGALPKGVRGSLTSVSPQALDKESLEPGFGPSGG